jgi:hypothetical protein
VTINKITEGDSKKFPRLEIGHKSNRKVLNSAVSVLGQSLRETEDQLARSMMEGGKMCAPYKFNLIDLELLAA